MDEVRNLIRELRAELDQLQTQTETLGSQLARDPGATNQEELFAKSVDQIVERLSRLFTTVGTNNSQREIETARLGKPEPDWAQVVQFRRALERDKTATMRTLTLRDPAWVLRTFGEPTKIGRGPGGEVSFEYLRDEDNDGFFQGLILYFSQGFVVDALR